MQHNRQHNSQTQECQSAVQLFRLSAQPSSYHHSMVVQCIYSLPTHFTSPSPVCFPLNILDVYSSMWVIQGCIVPQMASHVYLHVYYVCVYRPPLFVLDVTVLTAQLSLH